MMREAKTKLCATEKAQAGENRNGKIRNQKWKQKKEKTTTTTKKKIEMEVTPSTDH